MNRNALIRTTALVCCILLCSVRADSRKEYNVRDFGARGDGIADDGAAFAKTIERAQAAGGSIRIVVPSGTYLLATAMDATGMLVLRKARHVALEGEGKVQLIATDPSKDIIRLEECENVAIRNILMDRRPFVFTQGTITSVDGVNNSISVTMDEGYDEPDSEYLDALRSILPFTSRADPSWDQTTPPPKMVSKERVATGRWRFILNRQPREDYKGRAFILWDNTYRGSGVSFLRSVDCSVENSGYYGGGGGAGFNITQCRGTITIKNYYIGIPEGSGRLFCAAGGSMEVNNRATVVLDGCDISRIDDDGTNIMSPFVRVMRQEAGNRIVVDANPRLFEPGDQIGLWDWIDKNERNTAQVVSVAATRDGFALLDLHKAVIVLRADLDNRYATVPVSPNYRRLQENDGLDRIVNLSATGRLVVRNCRISSARARGIVIKAQDCLVENNIFYGNKMPAILGGPKFYWEEGAQIRNLTIRNNLFEDIASVNIDIGSTQSETSRSNSNIVIEGNRFINFGGQRNPGEHRLTGCAIRIRNARGVRIENNQFEPSPNAPMRDSIVVIEQSERVSVKNNKGLADQSRP